MQSKVHPRLRLTLEVLDVLLGLKELRPWGLNGQVHRPIAVMNPIDQPHAAAREDLLHLVSVENHVADLPGGRHVLRIVVVHRSGALSACKNSDAVWKHAME